MKKMIVLATVALVAVSCGPKKTEQVAEEKVAPKMLVLYYSQTGNTKAVATEMATRRGADSEEIVPVQIYDGLSFYCGIYRSVYLNRCGSLSCYMAWRNRKCRCC